MQELSVSPSFSEIRQDFGMTLFGTSWTCPRCGVKNDSDNNPKKYSSCTYVQDDLRSFDTDEAFGKVTD